MESPLRSPRSVEPPPPRNGVESPPRRNGVVLCPPRTNARCRPPRKNFGLSRVRSKDSPRTNLLSFAHACVDACAYASSRKLPRHLRLQQSPELSRTLHSLSGLTRGRSIAANPSRVHPGEREALEHRTFRRASKNCDERPFEGTPKAPNDTEADSRLRSRAASERFGAAPERGKRARPGKQPILPQARKRRNETTCSPLLPR